MEKIKFNKKNNLIAFSVFCMFDSRLCGTSLPKCERLENSRKTEIQCTLKDLYFYSKGVEKDKFQAREWYGKSSEQGDPKGYYSLAEVNKSMLYWSDAIKYYEKAGALGCGKAFRELGLIYQDGLAGHKDLQKALLYFDKAKQFPDFPSQGSIVIDMGTVNTQSTVQSHFFSTTSVVNVIQTAEEDDDYNEVRDPAKQCVKGDNYYYGRGVSQDYEKAVEWYTKAALQGYADAQNGLGNRYYNGRGVSQYYEKAVEWYTKAALQGQINAEFNLGVCYANGQGVLQNYEKSVKWYTKAALQGYADAQNGLGNRYYNNQGVSQDYEKAVEWYTKAALQGQVNSQFKLGVCYANGQGVSQDYEKAVEWYTKAALQGNELAKLKLTLLKK